MKLMNNNKTMKLTSALVFGSLSFSCTFNINQ